MKLVSIFLISCLLCIMHMQAQVGNVGINTAVPAAMLHVKDSSVVFTGAITPPVNPGSTPLSGAGSRLMWYSNKAAFRAGRVTSAQWDKDSIGLYSFAAGINTIAKGESSFAIGEGNVASGLFSAATGLFTSAPGIASISFGSNTIAGGSSAAAFGSFTEAVAGSATAFGFTTRASGFSSTAFGQYSTAEGDGSTTFGFINSALGEHSIATGSFNITRGNNAVSMGENILAKSYASLVIGRFNDTAAISTTTWEPFDPVFIIGKGTANNVRSNAITILKNGRTGINTNTPLAIFHVKDSSVVFTGPMFLSTTVKPPVSGAGTRMMWYADKAALRAGQVIGTQWDKDSIGFRSVAMGADTKAKGFSTTAFGSSTSAIGDVSTALGLGNMAFGSASTAMGLSTRALGNISTSMGSSTIARGDQSVTMGNNTISRSFGSLVIGRFNDTTAMTNLFSWNETDAVFVIGNGADHSSRKNAFTVLKNGKTGINTFAPQAMVHVIRSMTSNGPIHSNAIVALEDNQNSYIQFSNTNNREAGILSGNELATIRSGMIFSADSSLIMRAGGNTTRMIIKKNGYIGINTTTPVATFHVKDSSVVFTGLNPLPGSPGSTPVVGAGTRMMWYAGKAAFRSGNVSGNQWNKDSIGIYSNALGINTKAKGEASVAMGSGAEALSIAAISLGINTKASGVTSFASGDGSMASGTGAIAMGTQNQSTSQNTIAMGSGSIANVNFATAIGFQNMATGLGSLAMGFQSGSPGTIATSLGEHTRARGDNTLAIGNYTTARPYASFVMGQFNDTSSINLINWDPNDPVFIIGNGVDETNRSNAVTILKNAKTGINTTTPDAMLHVVRDAPTNGIYNGAATAIFEGDQGSFIQLSSDAAMQSGVLAGSELTSLRSAMIFMPDSSIQLRAGGGTTRLFVKKDGNIGIGTLTPQKLLHINEGTGGGTYFSAAEMIIEDDGASYLQFSNQNTFESGILSGNSLTSIRSAMVFRPDSSINLRTGGNLTKMVIAKTGEIGIGENTPNARLHVSNGTGGNVYNAESDLIIEDNSHAYLQFSTPVNQEAGIFSGNNTMDIRSAIRFKSDSSIVATTGGTTTRLAISKNGNVAIGSASPDAKLDVQGTAIIGLNGTAITEIIKLTVPYDLPPIPGNSTATVTFGVANASVGSTVYISPSAVLFDGLIIAYARVSAAGVVEAKFTNTTGAINNVLPMDFYITVIR